MFIRNVLNGKNEFKKHKNYTNFHNDFACCGYGFEIANCKHFF